MFAKRDFMFPGNPPATKEAYFYRSIFSQHFPQESAAKSVPGGPSIACSTPAAIEWDIRFKEMASGTGGDCSGRAVEGVHVEAYDDALAEAKGARSKQEGGGGGKEDEGQAAKRQKQA